jgi:hypothetical protein
MDLVEKYEYLTFFNAEWTNVAFFNMTQKAIFLLQNVPNQ